MDKPWIEPVETSPDQLSLVRRLAEWRNRLNFNYETISSLLRVLGAAVLTTALSIFLFKDWHQGDDINRYFILLGFTALLAIVGLVCGRWIREGKGARMFLSLSLFSIPINFVILGALIHSQWPLGVMASHVPVELIWQAPDMLTALWVSFLSAGLLAAVTLFGFRVLAARSSVPLAAAFTLNNVLLLLPFRDSMWVMGLAAWMIGMVFYVLRRLAAQDKTLDNTEGVFARIVLVLPLLLLLGRTLLVYGLDDWMHLVLLLSGYVGLRHLSRVTVQSTKWRDRIDSISVAPALLVAMQLGKILTDLAVSRTLIVPIVMALFYGMMLELADSCPTRERRFRVLGALFLVGGMSLNLMDYPIILSAIWCVLSGVAVCASGIWYRHTTLMVLGSLGLLHGIGFQIDYAINFLDFGGWGSLAIIGVLSILSGSVIERYGLQWKTSLEQWRLTRPNQRPQP